MKNTPEFDLETEFRAIQAKRRVWLIWTGKIFRFLFITCLTIALAYNARSVGDTPLGRLTLNDLVQPIICCGLAVLCVKWLFDGPTEEAAEAWGGAALLLGFVGIALAFYLNS